MPLDAEQLLELRPKAASLIDVELKCLLIPVNSLNRLSELVNCLGRLKLLLLLGLDRRVGDLDPILKLGDYNGRYGRLVLCTCKRRFYLNLQISWIDT